MKPTSRLLQAILLLGAGVRIFQLGRESLWYDELYTVWASRLPLGELVWEVPASGHPPRFITWLVISGSRWEAERRGSG